jgi:antitoxin component YwqK of YwqJK toxin-antitoxin module
LEEEGDYANGMRQGKWINYFEGDEKQVSEVSHFKDGLLDGSYVSYHVDGQKAATGAFQKGKYDGTWNWFLEDGTLESEVRYVEGKKTGEQLFYSEFGAVLKREVYEDGELIETILP